MPTYSFDGYTAGARAIATMEWAPAYGEETFSYRHTGENGRALPAPTGPTSNRPSPGIVEFDFDLEYMRINGTEINLSDWTFTIGAFRESGSREVRPGGSEFEATAFTTVVLSAYETANSPIYYFDLGPAGFATLSTMLGYIGHDSEVGYTDYWNHTVFMGDVENPGPVRFYEGYDIRYEDIHDVTIGQDERFTGSDAPDFLFGDIGDDTLIGLGGEDTLIGGAGDDVIDPGTTSTRDLVLGSRGDDQVIFSNIDPNQGFVQLLFDYMTVPLTVAIDGAANTGSIRSSEGTTTLVDVATILQEDTGGLDIHGSPLDDVFTVDAGAQSYVSVLGLQGADTFNLTLSDHVRLDYRTGARFVDPENGITLDLAQGIAQDDGFGFRDTINITDGPGFLEIQATFMADNITGSDRNEAFLLRGGQDTLDAGGGLDGLRFDRDDIRDLVVDLSAGRATGQWDGVAMDAQIAGVEIVTGTGFRADQITGSAAAETLYGLGGNDTLRAGDGNDTVIAGAGDDSVDGGATEADLRDVIFGGDGNDTIDGGHGNDELRGDAGNDSIAGGFGADTVIGGAGNDTLTGSAFGDEIFGGDGDDFINGGFGSDRVNGGTGADRFFHLGISDHGSDWIQDYNGADGDVLVFAGSASRADFQINTANTPDAGSDAVSESFIIYRPTEQILWALVDGAAQDQILLRIGQETFDLSVD